MKKASIYFLVVLALLQQLVLAQRPIITSVAPASAPIGATITIKGNNFGNSPVAYFGNVKGSIVSSTATSINVAVPPSAESQSITVTANKLISNANTDFSVERPCTGIIDKTAYEKNYSKYQVPGVDTSAEHIIYCFLNADFDGDGKIDMVHDEKYDYRINGAGVGIYRNISTVGNISFQEDYKLPSSGNNICSIAKGDFDGDGKIDITYLVKSSEFQKGGFVDKLYLYVFKNTSTKGKLSFELAGRYQHEISQNAKLFVKDMDGDGRLDIISFATGYDPKCIIFRNNSPQLFFPIAFEEGKSFNQLTQYGNYSQLGNCDLAIEDLNLDGKPDMIISGTYHSKLNECPIYIIQNSSNPGTIAFTSTTKFVVPTDTIDYRIQVFAGKIDNGKMPGVAVKITVGSSALGIGTRVYSFRNSTAYPGGPIVLNYNSKSYINFLLSVDRKSTNYDPNITNLMMCDIDGDGINEFIGYDGIVGLLRGIYFQKDIVVFTEDTSQTIWQKKAYLSDFFDLRGFVSHDDQHFTQVVGVNDFDGDGNLDIIFNGTIIHHKKNCSNIAFPRYSANAENVSNGEAIAKSSIRLNAFQNGSSLDISFSTPQATKATLELYDMAGRKIGSLFNGFAEGAKEYKLSYDASHLSKSVYICKVITSKEVISESIVIAK